MTEYQSAQQSQSKKDKIFQLRRKLQAAENNRNDLERQRIDLYADIARLTRLKTQANKDKEKAEADGNQSEADRLKAEISDLDAQISDIEKERARLKIDLDYWQGIMDGIQREIRDLMDGGTPLNVPIKNESQASSSSGMLELQANNLDVDTPREARGQKADPLDRSRFNLLAVKQKLGAMLGRPVASEELTQPGKPVLPILPPRDEVVWPGTGPEIGEPIYTSPGFPTPEDGVVPPEVGLPSIDLPDPGMPEVFYPSQPAKKPTPEQLGFRRARRDGQPLSKVEIFYPDDSRANEYTYVRKETEPREKTLAEILYDNPTSWPKK